MARGRECGAGLGIEMRGEGFGGVGRERSKGEGEEGGLGSEREESKGSWGLRAGESVGDEWVEVDRDRESVPSKVC